MTIEFDEDGFLAERIDALENALESQNADLFARSCQ